VVVIKIGGHLLFNGKGEFRKKYVSSLINVLRKVSAQASDDVVVVVGGGVEARRYIKAGRGMNLSESLLDILGIHVSRLNAALLFEAYHGVPPVIPTSIQETSWLSKVYKPLFMGGLEPGQSTTTVSALVAEALGERLIIATDVPGIFDSDPRINPSAKLLSEASISFLKSLFWRSSGAGGYEMLDPLTLNVLERSRIDTIVVSGDPPENILRVLLGEKLGTKIVYD